MKLEKYLISGLFLLFLYLHFYGINWGIPDKQVSSIVFKNKKEMEKLIPVMLTTHQEIREMQVYYGAPYKDDYQLKQDITVDLNGKKPISREIINSCRSYLTRSAGADEQAVLVSLSKMSPSRLNFNPHFYEYGGAYLYPIGIFLYISSKFHIFTVTSDMSFYFLNPCEIGEMYIAGRAFGAAGAFISIIIFLLICRELFENKNLSYLLTLFYGASAGFVVWSHYLKPFSYGMLWFLLTLYGLVKFYKSEKEKWIYIASIFSGLSFGTLLTYGYVYWAVVIFVAFYNKPIKWKIKTLYLTFLIFLGTFFITNPYILISYKEFIQELHYLKTYWHKDVSLNALYVFLFNTKRYGLGTMLWITLIVGLTGNLFYKPDRLSFIFFIIIIPAFFYFAFTTAEWIHYSIFLYPLFIISTGLFLARIRPKKIIIFYLVIIALYTVLYTSSYIKLFGMENTRREAGVWINENISSDEKIGLFEAPSPWRTPPFRFLDYDILILSDKTEIEKEKPEYFIVSEYQWLRGSGMEKIKDILSNYKIFKRFEREPSIFGIKFRHQENIPYDWCHPNPVILVWKRKR
ncbi:MAG: glycosyltransferase family 39 protein [Candidatus Omnitrophica bacterium]|nr:glycosyltransferase family 39 protein [Candidatus Omnitrophota bacterium]